MLGCEVDATNPPMFKCSEFRSLDAMLMRRSRRGGHRRSIFESWIPKLGCDEAGVEVCCNRNSNLGFRSLDARWILNPEHHCLFVTNSVCSPGQSRKTSTMLTPATSSNMMKKYLLETDSRPIGQMIRREISAQTLAPAWKYLIPLCKVGGAVTN